MWAARVISHRILVFSESQQCVLYTVPAQRSLQSSWAQTKQFRDQSKKPNCGQSLGLWKNLPASVMQRSRGDLKKRQENVYEELDVVYSRREKKKEKKNPAS